MKGNETTMLDYLEGKKNRYVIPVYQRKYSWRDEQCKQLYADLKKVISEQRSGHFFGSIVSSVEGEGSLTNHYIIDGQQRVTTVTLLLLVLCNMLRHQELQTRQLDPFLLADEIYETYLISKSTLKGDQNNDQIKLQPVESDREAFKKLFDFNHPEEFDSASRLTQNYKWFQRTLRKDEVVADDLYDAIGKLEIISITLGPDDNAQLIFESLNSTGLDLSEGDKIRNFVLMGLNAKEQKHYYTAYWKRIEEKVGDDTSSFIRDYLTVKQGTIPNQSKVYVAFKSYTNSQRENGESMEAQLQELLKYAEIYQKLLTNKSGIDGPEGKSLDLCMERQDRLGIKVTWPFFMEVFRLLDEGVLTTGDVQEIYRVTENYLFRRSICDLPTGGLNKIYAGMHREIERYDGTTEDYTEKYKYAITHHGDSGRFPGYKEFTDALTTRNMYSFLQSKSKTLKPYIFERLENYGTAETHDIYTHLDNGVYSVEHIMPQTLNSVWREDLGPDAEEIHNTWKDRLANLTLTAYNSKMSNKSFIKKRDCKGGYVQSGLRVNQGLAKLEHWRREELEARNEALKVQAKKIWPYPEITYKLPEKEYLEFSLDDEEVDPTNMHLVKYVFHGKEVRDVNWSDMYVQVMQKLHRRDGTVLNELIYGDNENPSGRVWFSDRPENLISARLLDEGIYANMNSSTSTKFNLLRRWFALYDEDPENLVFYVKREDDDTK